MDERIELRCEGGPLLGVLVGGTAIEVKRGARLFEIDLFGTLSNGAPVVFERLLEGVDRVDKVDRVDGADKEPKERADSSE